MPTSIVWFRRDLRLSDHPALIEAVQAAGATASVVPAVLRSTIGCGSRRATTGGRSSPAASAPSTTPSAGTWSCATATRCACVPGAGRRGGGRRGVRHRRLRALRRPAGRRRGGGPGARPGAGLRRVGLALRRDPGTVRTGVGRAVPGVHALLEGVGRPRVAGPEPGAAAGALGDRRAQRRRARRARRRSRRCPSRARRRPSGPPAGSGTPASSTTTSSATCPGADATSRLSPYLKWGCLHPRQLLHQLGVHARPSGPFRTELGWREFYADVLHHRPDTARRALDPRMAGMEVDGRGTAPALRRLVRGPHRLPDRRRRDAPAASPRAGCTTACGCSSPASS